MTDHAWTRLEVQILVFSGTAAYRHASIPTAIEAIERLCAQSIETERPGEFPRVPLRAVFSENPKDFTNQPLANYKVIVFLQSSGEFFTSPNQLDALKEFVRSGGGVVGIHCASFAMESSEWYGKLMGAVFHSHPEPQLGQIQITDPSHPITMDSVARGCATGQIQRNPKKRTIEGAPKLECGQWEWFDEWYLFKQSAEEINENVHVLMTGGVHGKDYPLAWCQEFEGGRSFYTSLGHFDEAYENKIFLDQLVNGILWATGVKWDECCFDVSTG